MISDILPRESGACAQMLVNTLFACSLSPKPSSHNGSLCFVIADVSIASILHVVAGFVLLERYFCDFLFSLVLLLYSYYDFCIVVMPFITPNTTPI